MRHKWWRLGMVSMAMAAFTVAAGTALANTHDVPGEFTTITAALASASPGDTIQVAVGLYSPSTNGEAFPLSLNDDSLCLLGAGMGQSILDAESTASVILCTSSGGGRISGFTVTGGWASSGGGIWVKQGTVEIDHNWVRGNGATIQGAGLLVDSNAWVHHNVIWGNFDNDTTDASDPHGMVIRGASITIAEHNLIGRTDGNGLSVSGTAAPTVRHNIFYENGKPPPGARGRGICWFSENGPFVNHNLFHANQIASFFIPGMGGNYSAEEGNNLDPEDGIYGNLDADPLLADPDQGDFQLSWGSPAIDAGDSTLPGDPDGTVADIGPFYFDQSNVGVSSWTGPPPPMLSVAPNPFNPETVIRLQVTKASRIQVDVFDIRGRRVRTLFHGGAAEGLKELPWDGRNDRGEEVASGIYLCRAYYGGRAETAPMVLIR